MKQVWQAVNGDIFDTQKECIDFERSLFEEREDLVKKFHTALSLMDEACRQAGCDYCPIHSLCDKLSDNVINWTNYMDENARLMLSKEVD